MAAEVGKVFSPFVMLVHEKGGADGPAAAFFSPPMYVRTYYVGLVRVALLDPFSNAAKHRWLAASIPTVCEKGEGELKPFPLQPAKAVGAVRRLST